MKSSAEKNKNKYNFDKLSPVEVYKLVYTGKIKKFPRYTWDQPDSIEYAAEIIRFLIEDILRWSDKEIKNNLSVATFKEHGLKNMLIYCFNFSPFQAINAAYPGRFKQWELTKSHQRFWTEETIIKVVKWLIEEKLQWTDAEIKAKFSVKLLADNKLGGLMSHDLIRASPFQAIQLAYPGRFKEWELGRVANRFWTKDKIIEVTKWLFEEKLQWTDAEIKKNLSQKTFQDNELGGMMNSNLINRSPFQAFQTAYPGRFKEWEFKMTPTSFWTPENGIKATKWLIEEKMQWSDEAIKMNLTGLVFRNNRLKGMLTTLYNGSPFKAINAAYPGRFKEWEFKMPPLNFWNTENAIKAIKWLIEEKLKWSDAEIKEKLKYSVFKKYGLAHVLEKYFKSSTYLAMNTIYPGRFKPEDFGRYRNQKLKKPATI